MVLTPHIVGIVIAVAGVLIMASAGLFSRQIHRLHVHAIEQIEPSLIIWPVRSIGLALAILGAVTLLTTV